MVVLAAVTAQSASAQSTNSPSLMPVVSATAVVPTASVDDRAATATLLHPANATADVSIAVSFKPRRAALLARLASSRSHAAGIPLAELKRLFAPSSTEIASTSAYLASHGLTASGGGLLTRSYTGSVANAEAAFGTTLATYKSAGVTFRSPVQSPQLPVDVAAGIASVSGLDTYPAAKPATALPAALPAVNADCAGSTKAQGLWGEGYQPNQLAAPNAYDFESLINSGANGSGDSLAVVEFSTYSKPDVTTYQACYGTSVPITDVLVNSGPVHADGPEEVELDQEIAATAAPGLDHIYNFNGPNVGFPAVLDTIVNQAAAKHINEVSISWGLCELNEDPGEVASTDSELQLLAAAGISVFASSGDDGATGCHGQTQLSVSFPATDPYVTAVGGTTLRTGTSGTGHETTWGTPNTGSGGAGGGGMSTYFTMPAWQTGAGVVNSFSEPGPVRPDDDPVSRGTRRLAGRQPRHRLHRERRHLGLRPDRRHQRIDPAAGGDHRRRQHVFARPRRHPDRIREPVLLRAPRVHSRHHVGDEQPEGGRHAVSGHRRL